VALRPWTRREVVLAGAVAELGSRIDPVTRTLRIKAAIPNKGDAIRPGTSFDVQIAFTGGRYATIPEVAVLWSRDGAYLWRVTDNKAEKVFVSIVRRDKGRILVDGPLSAGDTIVVEGVQGLRAAQKLRTKPFAATVSPTPSPTSKGG
jgi:multidrug efflux pump subunit AcrA (membrane-fusion protein)